MHERRWRIPPEFPDRTIDQLWLRFCAKTFGRVAGLKRLRIASITRFLKQDRISQHKQHLKSKAIPEWLDLKLRQISYCDVIETADHKSVLHGLDSMVKDLGNSLPFPRSLIDEQRQRRDFEFRPGSWRDIGFIDLKKHSKYFEYAWVHLYELSPTMACITINACPNEKHSQKFLDILNDTETIFTQIHSNRKIGLGYSISWIYREHRKALQLNRLRLLANQDIGKVINKYINSGWSGRSPLPSVECLGYKLTGPYNKSDGYHELTHSVRRRPGNTWNFTNPNGFEIDDTFRVDLHEASHTIRVTFNETKVISCMRNDPGYIDDSHRMLHALNSNASPLVIVAAIDELLSRISIDIARLRKHSRIHLKAQSFFDRLISGANALNASRLLDSANTIAGDLSTLNETIAKNTISRFFEHHVIDYKRNKLLDGQENSYSKITEKNIEARFRQLKDDVEVLQIMLRDHVTSKLERVMYWLTLAGLLVGLTSLLNLIDVEALRATGAFSGLMS
ncbi:MAG: hypothetical protein AAGG38_01545 [Planctomycetota bacterium]